jgi:CheY-like chemotaxis protein
MDPLRMAGMTYRVLVVDDSKLARMVLAKSLRALQPEWTRVEATNAEEALALVRGSSVDVALLDFNMPGRDGLDLAADLRKLHPTMPVAVISANTQVEIINRTHEIGATFLPKPLADPALKEFLIAAALRLGSTSQ